MGRACGLEVHVLTPGEARALYPLIEVGDLAGAIYIPADGQANPIDIAQALAKGARQSGAGIFENCRVTGITEGARASHGRRDRARPDPRRGRGQLRRDVGARGRAHGRGQACRCMPASTSTS